MWGSDLFEEAKTAKDRRIYRSSKRRTDRRKERINILQSLFLDDMEKEYPNFFPLLRESSLDFEDKIIATSIDGIKYNLFSEKNITDKNFYDKFPTIYHLRNYLIENKEKVDIRFVYLAIHHIIKHRGNFLYDGDFSKDTTEVESNIYNIEKYLEEKFDIVIKDDVNILEILKEKGISKSQKKEKLLKVFDYNNESKAIVTNFINSFLGYTFDLSKIFEIEIEKSKISFSKEIENEDEIKEVLKDNSNIFEDMHTIYNWFILQDILKGEGNISKAFINKYKKYGNDLKLLKRIYKEFFPEEYNDMFRKIKKNNYVEFTGKNSGEPYKKCNPEEFYKSLKAKIETLPDECEEKGNIIKEIEDNEFLKKIKVTDNGAIPHQLHEKELKIILENQSKYYEGIQKNKEKIISLFSFRIPYYIGPLAKNNEMSKWSWVIRKNKETIRPWNFYDVVDVDATAEEFINRMTNNCTYIINETVIPKQSLLYSEYCVLNELNNIRVEEKHLAKDIKEKVVENLFKKHKRVSSKMLSEYLKNEGLPHNNIVGFTDQANFNSNMSSYIDLEKIIGKIDESNYEECEKIIYWITIFEDKKILKRKIEKEFGNKSTRNNLSDEQIKKIVKLKYSGWSRLSKKLINGLKSYDGDTIIEKLRKTPENFMQIINNKKYGFDKQLEELMPKPKGKIVYEDVEEIPTSPANKRAIWQSVCIVKEITKIMKSEPKNIFIEFARNEENNKSLKDKRAKKLLKIYDSIGEELKFIKNNDNNVYKQLKDHQSDKTLSEKMYLYFIQGGKCLYSGKPLNIDELNKYEVDHIIPQSFRKDDSIDNKALVIKSMNQRKKDNLTLSQEIIDNRKTWWKMLLDNGLISQTKYYRLIRTKMLETDFDREKFVSRQLVETRQITKYVTNLLKNTYKETDNFSLRAELTHGFRQKYKLYKNRNINNYHHAQDAYILNTIGNILNEHWKGNNEFKYSEYVKKYIKDQMDKEKNHKEKYGIIIGFIAKYIDIEKVRRTFNYKDCYITRKLQEETGEFYKQTLYSPNDQKINPVIPLKVNKDVYKYGGYSGENKAYYVIYTYTNNKEKKEYELIGIPIQVAYNVKNNKETIENYIINKNLKDIDYSNFHILKKKILKNQEYFDENNELMRFCSDTEIRCSKELIINEEISELVYLMNTKEDKLEDEEKEKLDDSYNEMFEYFLDKLENEYKVFINVQNKLIKKKELFFNLSKEDKKQVINGLIDLMGNGQGNLKKLELTDREGRMSKINFKTKRLLNITFIDKSITGMYERRYKIDGMENTYNK